MAENTAPNNSQPQRSVDPLEVDRGRILMNWTYPEFEKHERPTAWYVVAIGLGTLLLWYAITDGNFLFALIILLFALIVFTQHRNTPEDVHFSIHDAGMSIGDQFYLFRELKAFAVIYEPPHVKRLYIYPKRAILRHEISIPLQDQNPLEVRSVLLDFIDEDLEKEEESPSDRMRRVLKF